MQHVQGFSEFFVTVLMLFPLLASCTVLNACNTQGQSDERKLLDTCVGIPEMRPGGELCLQMADLIVLW